MRSGARIAMLATAFACSAGLTGCADIEYHFGPLQSATAAPAPMASPYRVTRAAPAKRSVLKRVIARKVVPAGQRIRGFCGQRHIRFQSGGLRESTPEKARNDVLCRQEYKG